jgi:hypothetical protein
VYVKFTEFDANTPTLYTIKVAFRSEGDVPACGVIMLIEVELDDNTDADTPFIVTVGDVKLVPVIVTVVPPKLLPDDGLIKLMVGDGGIYVLYI